MEYKATIESRYEGGFTSSRTHVVDAPGAKEAYLEARKLTRREALKAFDEKRPTFVILKSLETKSQGNLDLKVLGLAS